MSGKLLLGKNIKFLANKMGKKLGELEAEVNVSTGYFSRLSSDEGKGSTIVDVLLSVADKLNTSIASLICADLSELTPNAMLLVRFFDKLNSETLEDKIVWNLEKKSWFDESFNCVDHPLFTPLNPYAIDSDFRYESKFDLETFIAGDCYNTELGYKKLYLMNVCTSNTSLVGYELYFVDQRDCEIEPICRAYPGDSLYKFIDELYKNASVSSRHLKLSKSVLATIEDYIDPYRDANVPF